LEPEASENAVIRFSSLQGSASASLRDIMDKGFICPMGGLNLQLEMGAAVEDIPVEQYGDHLSHTESIPLPSTEGEHAYWAKVLQTNGNAAWSSPVFVRVGNS
jgi:hypothetical protein